MSLMNYLGTSKIGKFLTGVVTTASIFGFYNLARPSFANADELVKVENNGWSKPGPGPIAGLQVKCYGNPGTHTFGNTEIRCENDLLVGAWHKESDATKPKLESRVKSVTQIKDYSLAVPRIPSSAGLQVKCYDNPGIHIFGGTTIECQGNLIVNAWKTPRNNSQ